MNAQFAVESSNAYPQAKEYFVNDRLNFIKKVYGILSVQLIVTVFISAVVMSSESITGFLRENQWIIILSIVGIFATEIPLLCCRGVARKYPTNMILLFTFVGFI